MIRKLFVALLVAAVLAGSAQRACADTVQVHGVSVQMQQGFSVEAGNMARVEIELADDEGLAACVQGPAGLEMVLGPAPDAKGNVTGLAEAEHSGNTLTLYHTWSHAAGTYYLYIIATGDGGDFALGVETFGASQAASGGSPGSQPPASSGSSWVVWVAVLGSLGILALGGIGVVLLGGGLAAWALVTRRRSQMAYQA